MDEKEKQASVPYFIHEGQMARMESCCCCKGKASAVLMRLLPAHYPQ